MSRHGVVKPAAKVVFQEVEGEMVLLDLEAGTYYALDDVGTRCWQLLVEHGNVDSVVSSIVAEYDVDESTARSDVEALVEQLGSAGLVTSQAPSV